LAQANPDAYLPDLAGSVNNLASRLADLGRQQEALTLAQRAVDLYRELAQANPDAYLPDLAAAVNNLALSLADLEQQQEALAPAQEAVEIRRGLAQANPDACLPDLAMSVNNLALLLADLGRGDQVPAAWRNAGHGLPATAEPAWRVLHAAWDWVYIPGYDAEHAHLHAHPELLAPGSETHLVHVLRYQNLDEAERYLAIIDLARRTDIDTAYNQIMSRVSQDK
jgi:tetratricopeptide (TPR) repeat protein